MRRLILVGWLMGGGVARAADQTDLVVETGSPDALCPELGQARAAVSRRIGALELPGPGAWTARYTIGHAPEGSPRDFVKLELFDAQHRLRLGRSLPLQGESCETMAEVIALVLERYFRGLASEQRPPSPPSPSAPGSRRDEPGATTEPPPASAATGSQAGTRPARPTSTTESIRTTPSASVSTRQSPSDTSQQPGGSNPLGLLLATRLALDFEPARALLGIQALGRSMRNVYAGGEVLYSLQRTSERLSGQAWARASAAALRAYAGWGPDAGRLLWFLGPEVSLRLERARAEGLDIQEPSFRAVWSVGPAAGAVFRVSRRLALSASGGLDVTIPGLTGKLYVDDRQVLRPARARAWIGLGAGVALTR